MLGFCVVQRCCLVTFDPPTAFVVRTRTKPFRRRGPQMRQNAELTHPLFPPSVTHIIYFQLFLFTLRTNAASTTCVVASVTKLGANFVACDLLRYILSCRRDDYEGRATNHGHRNRGGTGTFSLCLSCHTPVPFVPLPRHLSQTFFATSVSQL